MKRLISTVIAVLAFGSLAARAAEQLPDGYKGLDTRTPLPYWIRFALLSSVIFPMLLRLYPECPSKMSKSQMKEFQ